LLYVYKVITAKGKVQSFMKHLPDISLDPWKEEGDLKVLKNLEKTKPGGILFSGRNTGPRDRKRGNPSQQTNV